MYFVLTKNSERILQRCSVVKQGSAAFCAGNSVPTDSLEEAETPKAASFSRWGVDESALQGHPEAGSPSVSAPAERAIRMSHLHLSGKAFYPNLFFFLLLDKQFPTLAADTLGFCFLFYFDPSCCLNCS